ncbi:hypothetical protein KDAU_35620 [Dictyobacter aurantiacus]|uniref:Uncharacterized protein n=1 Tax=Dictyobacter aurantiacus TaxID=1936993 RepID=A0A401ZHG5_9CHLR|nr:hypothetical protein KDAU_35620 [Dictyobacter aurantiacus]
MHRPECNQKSRLEALVPIVVRTYLSLMIIACGTLELSHLRCSQIYGVLVQRGRESAPAAPTHKNSAAA